MPTTLPPSLFSPLLHNPTLPPPLVHLILFFHEVNHLQIIPSSFVAILPLLPVLSTLYTHHTLASPSFGALLQDKTRLNGFEKVVQKLATMLTATSAFVLLPFPP
jgi:hypothetical protein